MALIIVLQLVLFAGSALFPEYYKPLDLTVSFLFLATSLVLWIKNKYIYNKYAFWGMIFCFIGDLIMASIIKLPDNLICGIISFSIAHILFIIGFNKTAKFSGLSLATPKLLIGLIIYPVLMTLAWWFYIYNPNKILLSFGALVYGILLCLTAAFALALYMTLGKSYLLAAIGSVFFIISDCIIGMTSIRGSVISHSITLIWFTYIIALMGIIYSNSIVIHKTEANLNNNNNPSDP
ncbi:MAG: YhhN-like protein [Firmicutes bacterium ADurb.Bin419]|mgnify:CR=1 FL=1|nr:MAG: YhhN-like protein [Firmicutes bacterium ADurb.Bin419]